MAYADYRLCDVCGCKTFYDSNLNYEYSTKLNPIDETLFIRGSHYKLENLGDWAVLCRDCAVHNECVIRPRPLMG